MPNPNMNRPRSSGLMMFLVLVFLILGAFTLFSPNGMPTNSSEVSISQFVQDVNEGKLLKVTIDGNKVLGENEAGENFRAILPEGTTLRDVGIDVNESSAEISYKDLTTERIIGGILTSLLPIILILLLLFFMLRQAQGSANSAFSFGQSRARLHDKTKNKTTFKDVAGAEEAKEDLADVVDFLKNPKKYQKMGAKIPKGVLLYGAPGTGKTLLARAVAGEADVPFFTISGSEFVEMFVGVGASRVRDLFKKAKRSSPSIIYIDEIDAVGRQRGSGMGGGHDEREQTLNQILTEMDGFEEDANVIVVASTNRPDVLDPALLRPGRFDRRVVIDRPSIKEREAILKVHSRKKPLAKDVNLSTVAKKTPGFTGADLENLLNEAAILSAKKSMKEIHMAEVNESIEKVTLGPQKRATRLNDYEKELTAYHELGHAVVGLLHPHCDPVHKISIISRGMALGVTWFLPQEDVKLQAKIKFEQEIRSLLGGRAAEEVFYGKENVTTGASNDLERASQIARDMVTHYGMTDAIGHMVLETKKNVFLGRDLGEEKNYSDETAQAVDAAVRKIIDDAYTDTVAMVKKHKALMEEMCKDLLKKEELSEEEFLAYFKKKKITVPTKIGVERAKNGSK